MRTTDTQHLAPECAECGCARANKALNLCGNYSGGISDPNWVWAHSAGGCWAVTHDEFWYKHCESDRMKYEERMRIKREGM